MFRSNSETTTSTTSSSDLSPFSNYSAPSEPTSDELPDLGAFHTVLREFTYLQPGPRVLNSVQAAQNTSYGSGSSRTRSRPQSTSYGRTNSEDESEDYRGPQTRTVWSQRPIASYLTSRTSSITATEQEPEYEQPSTSSRHLPLHRHFRSHTPSDEPGIPSDAGSSQQDTPLDGHFDQPMHDDYDSSSSETEGEAEAPQSVEIDVLSELDFTDTYGFYDDRRVRSAIGDDVTSMDEVDDQPSLGYLDEALGFIAAEREKWSAQREAATLNSPDGDGSRQGVELRRKRRRKRTKTPRARSSTRPISSSVPSTSIISTSLISANSNSNASDADADDSSSSYDPQYSTTTNTHTSSSGPIAIKTSPSTPRRKQKERGRRPRRASVSGVISNPLALKHSQSTPQLRLVTETPTMDMDNPRTKLMIALSKKLAKLFPEDKAQLAEIDFTILPPSEKPIMAQYPDGKEAFPRDPALLGGFVDTRGPPPPSGSSNARIIHVFVDHSNISIGLLTYLKRNPHQHPQYRQSAGPTSPTSSTPGGSGSTQPYPKPPKHLSHSALSLILERGRPISRRVMVTSSPLYQPMESAQQLGYEVRVFARVPDMGDGMDRERRPGLGHSRSISSGSIGVAGGQSPASSIDLATLKHLKNSASVRRKFHNRRVSGSTSTESEQNGGLLARSPGSSFPNAFVRSLGSPPSVGATAHTAAAISASLPTTSPLTSSASPSTSAGVNPPSSSTSRIRYREQGVDELLQLKLHQALASIDGVPPPGSTIILATGDGNVGQFNEDGFLGGVRTALKKGWIVELYAWEGGLSKAWKREFGEGSEWAASHSDAARFRVVHMEQFGSELVEVYY